MVRTPGSTDEPRTVGRYGLGGLIASGGMAAVHLGRVRGAVGFSRLVAIKRMHPHFASDPDFATMFADEARLAARIRHPNVVSTLDVVFEGGNLSIVMEYIEGVTLAQLMKIVTERGVPMPATIAVAILRDLLEGLHSAHEAVDTDGRPLGIVHRDVSPQNVIVGVDGGARVLDFGIAKANVRLHATREGSGLKGKLAYMSPEQLEGGSGVRQSDLFAAAIVLWEALTSQRAYAGQNEGAIVARVLRGPPPAPSSVRPELGTAYDPVVMRGLARIPEERFESARDMAIALTDAGEPASAAEVGEWVKEVAALPLAERTAHVRDLENDLSDGGDIGARDPEGTLPATPASRIRQPPSPPPQAVEGSVARRLPSTPSRLGVAALVAAACGLTAIVMSRLGAGPPPPVPVLTAPAVTVASPEATVAPSAGPTSSAVLLQTPDARPALASPVKTRRSPPRTPSRAGASPSIPDHL